MSASSSQADQIDRAVEVLRGGGLIALPTETVYGLGADAENPAAVMKIFAAKGRPTFHPMIVHLASVEQMCDWAEDVSDLAWQVAERFWPGPLTIIVRKSRRVPGVVTGDLPTVGLRVPAHRIAQAVLRAFGGGIAAPSANRFGRLSPTTAEHVRAELEGRVDLILDGGPCEVGLESTIIDLSGDQPAILRPGGVTAEQLQQVVPSLTHEAGPEAPHCSGRLASHYAPRADVQLVEEEELPKRLHEAASHHKRVAIVGAAECEGTQHVNWFVMPRAPEAYARQLYATLRQADDSGVDLILVVLPEASGLGAAIADRLRKAAAPRE